MSDKVITPPIQVTVQPQVISVVQIVKQGPPGPTGPAGPSGGVGLGETSDTAFRGDYGKTAYDNTHTHGNKTFLDKFGESNGQPTYNGTAILGQKGDTGARGPQGETGPQGERGPQGIQGPKGDAGTPGSDGADGPQGVQGIQGEKGDPGTDGKTILYGVGNPNFDFGTDGDFYINTAAHTIFGPKAGGEWPPGVLLVGVPGGDGPQGPAGPPGLTTSVNGVEQVDGAIKLDNVYCTNGTTKVQFQDNGDGTVTILTVA